MLDKEIEIELDEAFWKSKPASANDCTGLIHDNPSCDEGIESYVEMYDIPKQGSAKG